MVNNEELFFIVGNSRSGTTMMLRILDNHPKVYCLNELHFFEHLWSAGDMYKTVNTEDASNLFSRLLYIQRKGYIGKTDPKEFLSESKEVISRTNIIDWQPHEVYKAMMQYETYLHHKEIPCEKTPQNVFYLEEIFTLFPQAKVINMIRDPRAILLSQKRKWLRRKMGATFITRWEVIRLRINYHPITLSRLWNAAIKAADKFNSDPRVLSVRFEDLLHEPEITTVRICEHLNIPFSEKMLDIPQASSSNEKDSELKGIKKERAGNWRAGGLSPAEIWWCQRVSGSIMSKKGYQLEIVKSPIIYIVWWALIFPIKLSMALLFNLNRMKNIVETIRKRMNP